VEFFGDKPGLVAINGAISFVFEVEHPFASNNVHVKSGRNKGPSTVAEKCIKLKVHGIMPSQVLGSCRVGGWFNIGCICGGSECFR
jgi:hypothetical protein